MMITPEQLRAARGWLGWSRQELATRSEVARHTIYNFEHDASEPGEDIQFLLCEALRIAHIEPTFSRGNPHGIRLCDLEAGKSTVETSGIFPEQIRAARGWLDWTAQDLAAASGIGHQTIAKYERGAISASIETQTALFRALTEAGVEPIYSRAGDQPVGVRLNGQMVPERNLRPAGATGNGSALTPIQEQMVESYQDGLTMRGVADKFETSPENVRLAIVKHETLTGESIERHLTSHTRDRERDLVHWECEICHTPRDVERATVKSLGRRCGRCRQIDVPAVKRWMRDYRRLGAWHPIGLDAGYPPHATHMVAAKVFFYLSRIGDTATRDEFWPDGIPRWLTKRYAQGADSEAA